METRTMYDNGNECWIYDKDRDMFFNADTFELMDKPTFFVYWNSLFVFEDE